MSVFWGENLAENDLWWGFCRSIFYGGIFCRFIHRIVVYKSVEWLDLRTRLIHNLLISCDEP